MSPVLLESFHLAPEDLAAALERVRRASEALAAGLSDGDLTPQSMEDASPGKWHLAHTTWFFEEFVLAAGIPGYRRENDAYRYLFNSYYETVGPRHPRPRRGLLTRPSLPEVLAYRARVDADLADFLAAGPPPLALACIELGLHHEQQHQELFLTDLLHLFAQNPLAPAYRHPAPRPVAVPAPCRWLAFSGGRVAVGHAGPGFAFDCEGPRHDVLLRPFRLTSRPVTNGEWAEFIADGGYCRPALWLSDGWKLVQAEGWRGPLHWVGGDGPRRQMTLHGLQPVDPAAPVAHLSYFEADAYARWAGKRLPSEFEWEAAARELPAEGNFADSGAFCPLPAPPGEGLRQMYGDVWEWTSSPFLAYPGFRPAAGAVGEYNGKFMCGQFVLRGGSCVTPGGHLRSTYRNFFYPHQRWQFAGLRLAEDGE